MRFHALERQAQKDIKTSSRLHLLKVPPPPNSTTLGIKLLTYGLLGTFKIQTIAKIIRIIKQTNILQIFDPDLHHILIVFRL